MTAGQRRVRAAKVVRRAGGVINSFLLLVPAPANGAVQSPLPDSSAAELSKSGWG